MTLYTNESVNLVAPRTAAISCNEALSLLLFYLNVMLTGLRKMRLCMYMMYLRACSISYLRRGRERKLSIQDEG